MTSKRSIDAAIVKDERTHLLESGTRMGLNQRSRKRWLMLFLASAVAFTNGIQNLQYASCESQVVKFFQVSFPLGDLLTQAYYISFVALGFPVIWIVMVKGLRFTVVFASALVLIGSVLTAASTVNRHLFSVALVAEFMAGCAQVFILCIPSLLAGDWFPNNELSIASGTVVFLYQLGSGVTLVVIPFVLPENSTDSSATLGHHAIVSSSLVAAMALLVFILVYILFSDGQRASRVEGDARNVAAAFRKSLKRLMSNLNFFVLILSYGVDYGLFSAMQSVFKAVLSGGFPGISNATTGQIVALMMLAGTPAPLIFGNIIDQTKSFVRTLLVIHAISIVGAVTLLLAMYFKLQWLVWISVAIIGFGLTGKMSVGLETAAEITYPEPEGSSSGILVWTASVFTVISVQVIRSLLSVSSVLFVNFFILGCLVLSLIFTCFLRSDLRRTRANYEVIGDAEP